MRVLFSAVPQHGHLLPLLPLAHAARAAGHETAVVTSAMMAEAVAPLPVLLAGPDLPEMSVEHGRREQERSGGAVDPRSDEVGIRFLLGTRADLTVDEAVRAARDFGPDLVVADPLDVVGPVVAGVLGVPWAVHAFGPTSTQMAGTAPSVPLQRLLDDAVDRELARRGAAGSERIAYLDPCPELLQPAGWAPLPDRIVVRPRPYAHGGGSRGAPATTDRAGRPLVAVTLGTATTAMTGDTTLLGAVATSVTSTAAPDVDVVATLGPIDVSLGPDFPRDRVRTVGFVPLDDLLDGVDAVVSVGGIGTVLATLSRGIPLVLLPVLWDQPFNARQAAATGAAVVVGSAQETGAAVAEVLGDPRYRTAAAAVAAQIAAMDPPEHAIDVLVDRVASRQDDAQAR